MTYPVKQLLGYHPSPECKGRRCPLPCALGFCPSRRNRRTRSSHAWWHESKNSSEQNPKDSDSGRGFPWPTIGPQHELQCLPSKFQAPPIYQLPRWRIWIPKLLPNSNNWACDFVSFRVQASATRSSGWISIETSKGAPRDSHERPAASSDFPGHINLSEIRRSFRSASAMTSKRNRLHEPYLGDSWLPGTSANPTASN